MPTNNCNTSIVQVLEADVCNGNRVSSTCVVHPTFIPSLSLLTAPVTQQQINDSLVTTVQQLMARIVILENAT